MSRRYSTASRSSTNSRYPYRQFSLEIRDGEEYMTVLPPMTTEEDLLHEELVNQPSEYTSYGPFSERRRKPKILQAIADLFRKLQQSLTRKLQ
ncbi:hypothetical protein C8Q74DRAFT_1370301 [Fomes fomentarius]|nr:hypothetical protein C8Q74DRAFT_1370301 [Fomes fomentarius]